ncbi:hypothetical protein [Phaeobacter sp. 11ANDIMAR09]|uniref:hypothetical protein n=1 Tax=Phaeobacter sp. 11ANDIMAR09 TaxID=1225647 RepID=UPI0006C8ACC9|nr:hypothetical protein [Phaeobacter sp. 11ANDIMAR09]KPD13566.1 hypothetical protein AN476_05080 [Phaeobacter sp. 11ANDIMAR09]OIQ35097.1 MAG: hypothetical protein BM559_03845 [Roseobacter sp. MedPE-SWchi]
MKRRTIFKTALAAIVASTMAMPAAALDRRVTIINDTNFTIVRFYGSNKGTDSWEEDILGRDVLRPGQRVRIDFDDGTGYCKFDFKAVFDDDDVLVANDINVCKIGTYTYH